MKMEYSVFKVEEKKDGRRNLFGTATGSPFLTNQV
jgi:hypothetical protein